MNSLMINNNCNNDGLSSSNRDVDIGVGVGVGVGVEIDVVDVGEVDTNEDDGDITGIETLDNTNVSNNFEAQNFGGDEWMRQLQQQHEDLIGGQNDAALNINSPQHQQQQYRHPYEQQLVTSSASANNSSNNNSNNNNSQHQQVDQSQQLQETEQIIQLQQQQQQESHPQILMPQVQGMDGLQQLRAIDNTSITALNNLIQQQQQQHHSHIPNITNQIMDSSLGAVQTLEQQLATLQLQQQQQQQQQQPKQNNQPQQQQQQQMTNPSLQDQLMKLQQLHQQQQQILQNMGHAGFIDGNSLANPVSIEALMNSLMAQLNNNNNGGNNNQNQNQNTAILGQNNNSGTGGTWAQIAGIQQQSQSQPQMNNNNSLQQNIAGMMSGLQPQIQQQQQQQVGFIATSDAEQNSQQQQPQHYQLQQNTFESSQTPGNNNSHNNNNNNNNNNNFSTTNQPPITAAGSKPEKKKLKPMSFPKQLWDSMMMDGPSNDEAFEWLPDGKSFVVVNSNLFCSEILDRKFKASKYGSFVRKLHRWGFIRLTSGTGTDCFHHPLFQREDPELVTQIKCNSRNGKDGKQGHNAYARGDIPHSAQPSLMGVEKFIRAQR